MRKILMILACATVLLSGCRESFDARLKRECQENTQKFYPQQIAADIREDSVVFNDKTRTLTHCYTLSGVIDTLYNDTERQICHEQYVNAVKSDMSLEEIRENGVNVEFLYFSAKSGKEVLRLLITENDYK